MAEGKDPVKLFPDADGRSPAGTGSTDTPTSPSGNGRKGDGGPSERCGGTAVIYRKRFGKGEAPRISRGGPRREIDPNQPAFLT